jgi:hypothetical protein
MRPLHKAEVSHFVILSDSEGSHPFIRSLEAFDKSRFFSSRRNTPLLQNDNVRGIGGVTQNSHYQYAPHIRLYTPFIPAIEGGKLILSSITAAHSIPRLQDCFELG